MSFFNKKEEVIGIELTPHGKALLAKGKFSPAFYEFYDDDILYDSLYADLSEVQGQTHERIKSTPSQKPQYSFDSVEKRLKKAREQSVKTRNVYVPILEERKNFTLGSLPLGNCSLDNSEATSISLSFLNGEIESTSSVNSQGLPRDIININLKDIKHKITFRRKEEGEPEEDIYTQEDDKKRLVELDDGTTIEVNMEEEYILLDMKEIGALDKNDNFEITIYELEEENELDEQGNKKYMERPLYFEKERSNIKDNILYERNEMTLNNRAITEEFVEYYFEVLADKQIPGEILCEKLSYEELEKLKQVDGYNIDCAEIERQRREVSQELFEIANPEEDC